METQMALAMSQAGKLFDKKNAGRPSGGDKAQDKAQGMYQYFDVTCVLNVLRIDSDAKCRCDCDADVSAVSDQGKAGRERHVKGYGACHELLVKNRSLGFQSLLYSTAK